MDLLLEIARTVRAAVRPHLGRVSERGAAGTAVGGDVTFGIDEIAEDVANKVLEEAASAGNGLAWYTEDRGLVVRGNPDRLIVLDPIDGTRPAGAGLESCCVSVAATRFDRDATLGDVDEGLVLELKTGALYRSRRGQGVRIIDGGETREPSPSNATSLDGAFWIYGLRGRPTIPSAIVLEELIDASGVSGGTFDLGSAAFAMCGIVTGRFDAYVDHGQRLIDDIPSTKPLFEAIAGGAILNNSPYDVAAALLICTEAGCTVTDAGGRPLEERPLVGSGDGYTLSTLATCTPELHADILSKLDCGIDRLRESELVRGA
jgi:myo-inositol-1(or 4)-monophosphatase